MDIIHYHQISFIRTNRTHIYTIICIYCDILWLYPIETQPLQVCSNTFDWQLLKLTYEVTLWVTNFTIVSAPRMVLDKWISNHIWVPPGSSGHGFWLLRAIPPAKMCLSTPPEGKNYNHKAKRRKELWRGFRRLEPPNGWSMTSQWSLKLWTSLGYDNFYLKSIC